MDASPYNRDTIATFLSDSIGQTGRGVKKPAHETYTDRIDFAFLYEVGHSVKIRGIVGSVKKNLGPNALVLQRRVNVLEPKIVGAVNKRNEQSRTLGGHDKFLSTRSDNSFSLAYQFIGLCGAHITTMALHGKCFLYRPYLYASAGFARVQSSDP